MRKKQECRIWQTYVAGRWIGGTLTNFTEIKKRVARLLDLAAQSESGELERKYTKKERVIIGREFDKLTYNFDGIKTMERIPQFMIVVDPRHNHIAVAEAQEVGIPVIGITSSDANLDALTYPVLVNDALRSSVTFVLKELTKAFIEGRTEFVPPKREESKKTASK